MQGIINRIQRNKEQALFLKLDIAKAFDSVLWSYMLELLQRLGFGNRWREWITTLLSTTTSRFLLNGALGPPIKHQRGLRQGDPLSPILFILAIDPLQTILKKAIQDQVIAQVSTGNRHVTISMYVDDVAIFIRPRTNDLQVLKDILYHFGQATGMHINLEKTETYPLIVKKLIHRK